MPQGDSDARNLVLKGCCEDGLGRCDQAEAWAEQALGLAPAMLHRTYLVDPTRINFGEHRGPSTVMACQLCAGLAATEALKILLGRRGVVAAPRGLHFDAYRGRLATTWRPGGNNNPLQRLALAVARRQFASRQAARDLSE